MKKVLFMLLGFAGCAVLPSHAAEVYQSTYSATTDFRRSLCAGGDRAYLHRVCVVDGVASSTAAVYSSSFSLSAQNLTGVIDSSAQGCLEYGVKAPNGLYADQFGTAGITILYDCYR